MVQNMEHLESIVSDLEEKDAMYNLTSLYGKAPQGLSTFVKEHKKLNEQFEQSIKNQRIKDFPKLLEQMYR